MDALTYHDGDLVLAETSSPLPRADWVLVDVIATGICGTDLGAFRHGRPLPHDGIVMGHEILGTVEGESGRVVVNPIVGCGHCALCVAGRQHRCPDRVVIGYHLDGGFAARVIVPADNVVAVPEWADDDRAMFSEPLATALHAWRLGDPTPGARVAVLGAGAIGLSVCLVAAASGVQIAECVDLDEGRRALAIQAGVGAARTSLEGGGYDVVFDCVGASRTRTSAIDALAPGGTCVMVGLAESLSTIDVGSLVAKEKTIRGAFAYSPRDFRDAVGLALEIPDGWVRQVGLVEGIPLTTGREAPPQGVVKIAVNPSLL